MESWLLRLPDDVIHYIIHSHVLCNSSLTNKEVIQLSLVSKEFSSTLQKRPFIVFNPGLKHNQVLHPKFKQCQHIFIDELRYVLSTLTRYKNENIHLDTFELRCSITYVCEYDRNLIDQCINLATARNLGLRNLSIFMPQQREYILPNSIFKVESLVQLYLNDCMLLITPGSIIMWPNLKRLYLYKVKMGSWIFKIITKGSPLIEFMEINRITNIGCDLMFDLSDLSYLKKLDIHLDHGSCQTVKLGASSNLEGLACHGDLGFMLNHEYREYHKLKSIKFSRLTPSSSGAYNILNSAHQFPVLEELSISDMRMKKINISNPSLKYIEIENICGLQELRFDVPNIVLFTLNNKVVPNLLSCIGSSSGWTSRISFDISDENIDSSRLKLKEFFVAINMSESSIQVSFDEKITNFHIKSSAHKSELAINRSLPHNASYCEILDEILLIFPMALYDHLMFNSREQNVTRIEMKGYMTKHFDGSSRRYEKKWHQILNQPDQVSDREKFMELFRVSGDDRNINTFRIVFNLEHCRMKRGALLL